MAEERDVLLMEGSDDRMAQLAGRLRAMGVHPVSAQTVDDAIRVLEERRQSLSAALFPTDLPVTDLKGALESLRKAGPTSGVPFVVVGERPEPDELERLRSAGVELALWEPFDDGTLRFQLNRVLNTDRTERQRGVPRVPTQLPARVSVARRSKDAIVYSLSVAGAFLEMARATLSGAQIDLEIQLPSTPVTTRALVVFSNVPGNLQQPNLPLGMGVAFLDLPAEAWKPLRVYIDERAAMLVV